MDIKVNGRTLSDRPLVLGVQGDNNVEELRFLVPRYTDAGVDLSLGIGYAVFRLPDGTDGHVSLTPEVLDTDENTVSLTLLVGSQMTEQKGSGKLCLKVAGLESAMWSSAICDMFVNGTIAMPSPQPVSLFRMMSVGPRLAEEESEPPLTVTERTINIPAELQTIAVAQDENSETVKIVVPRYFDGQDLSVHDFILHTEMGSNGTDDILFNNQNGQMKAVEDSTVTLTWVLRPPQTSFEGKLDIQLLVQGDEFKWHSLIGELTIAKHITGDPVVPATPSMYEQWLAEVKEQADYVRSQAANIQTVVDEMDAIKDAPAAAERAEAAAAEAEKSAAESKGFRTFYSAVVPDTNGNLDPSRPMTVGPAASVEIESAGDRIQSVMAHGFTKQAGTGDPSPSNVRQLTNGGIRLTEFVLDGNAVHSNITVNANTVQFTTQNGAVNPVVGVGYCEKLKLVIDNSDQPHWFPSAQNKYFVFFFPLNYFGGKTDKPSIVAALNANPVKVWYQDAGGTGSLYAPIILTSGEYRATCLPLTAPLCDGDSVVSWAKSGCDQQLTLDGTENFLVDSASTFADVIRFSIQLSDANTSSPVVFSERFTPSTVFTLNSEYIGITNIGKLIGAVYKSRLSLQDAEGVKAYFAAHPLTVWYRSTNYTPAADIPVSLETHQQAVLVLDGTEGGSINPGGGYISIPLTVAKMPNLAKGGGDNGLSSIAKEQYVWAGGGFYWNPNSRNLIFGKAYADQFESYEAFQTKIAELYSAGTPAQFVYPMATPITYAHPAVVLEAATGDQLTHTVTGQSGGTVSVALKPFQDGGHAATADNATNAITAQTAANSQQLGGLTLAALQNLLVPVGYIFSWAPVSNGPDLSTAQKVAAYFGFGTWAEYGKGQVLVGLDAGQTEFATSGKTGGEKTHTLTVQELPSHNHGVNGADSSGTAGHGFAYNSQQSQFTGTANAGGGQAHNNLQPYITVYRWQRVA